MRDKLPRWHFNFDRGTNEEVEWQAMVELSVLDTIYFSAINDDCTKIDLTWIYEFNCLNPREPMVLAKFYKTQVTS